MEKIVNLFARELDRVAQWAIVILMALVITNIVLRFAWRPLLGTYEFVSFLSAVVISFALAHCAVQRGHIAVTLIVDQLPPRGQAIVDVIINAVSIIFFGLTVWQISLYATDMVVSGEVSPTTKTPFYPFVYGVALGFLSLCLVLLVDLLKSINRAVGK